MSNLRTSRFALAPALTMVAIVLGLWTFQETGADTTRDSAERDIRALLDNFCELAKDRNWDELAKLYTDDCKIFADKATVFGKKSFMELLRSDELPVNDWSLNDLEIEVAKDLKSAWCRYQGNFDHGEFKVLTAETVIFEFKDSWQITHAHFSVKIVDEEKKGA